MTGKRKFSKIFVAYLHSEMPYYMNYLDPCGICIFPKVDTETGS